MNLKLLQAEPATFRRSLLVDADGQPLRLGPLLDPWQQKDFHDLDDAWLCVAGQLHGDHAARIRNRAYLERPRGHSKTSDLAVMATWALFASRRKLMGYGAAADADQARLLKDAIEKIVRLNPWLNKYLKVQHLKVTNPHTGSTLEILPSDGPTSYGLTPDFVICDEIVHWKKEDLWTSLLSAAAKRRHCLLVVITNAGYGESWQWTLREQVRVDRGWHFATLSGPVASWITQDRLAEQRRLLPKIAYERLWLNRWTKGVGDAISEQDLLAAISREMPPSSPQKGWVYVGGLDLGLSRDRAALAVIGYHVGYSEEKEKRAKLNDRQRMLIQAGIVAEPEPEIEYEHCEGTGRLRLVHLSVWDPKDSPTGKVDIEEIERAIVELDRTFRLRVGADPWQAAYLIERLQKRGVPIEPVQFSGENLRSMCSATLEAFTENNIELYHHPVLLTDLRNLKVVEKSYGIRLDSPRGPSGHGDTATALSISLHLTRQELVLRHNVENCKLIAYP